MLWEQVPTEAPTGLCVQLCHCGFIQKTSACARIPARIAQTSPASPVHRQEDFPRDTNWTLKNYYFHFTVGNRDPEGQNDQRVEAMQRREELTQVLHHCRSIQSSFPAPCVCVYPLTPMFGASPGLLGTARPFQIDLYRH